LGLKRPWVLTYDDVTAIQELYKDKRQFNLNYSVTHKRVGTGLLVTNDDILISESPNLTSAA